MIAILVPCLARAHQIQPLLDNIAEVTTITHRVILICSPNDPATVTALNTSATTLITNWKPDRADYAKKIALGFTETTEPWIFQAATDLVFHPNWDTNAMDVANRHGKGVIGTNDLGNPLVMKGRHSTHSFISRDYIERYGGTADNSGIVFSEQYDHQWCDTEFIETAKRRRQFISAQHSIVEHLHPHWGKAEYDKTYKKATRATQEDQKLFMERRRLIARASARPLVRPRP